MATRRHGSLTAFWNNAAAVANGAASSPAEIGRGADDIMIYLVASAAATVKVQVAHSGRDGPEGQGTDAGPTGSGGTIAVAPYDQWFDLFYAGSAAANQMQIVLAAAGNASLIIPDFSAGWVRLVLVTGTTPTLTAGYEIASG